MGEAIGSIFGSMKGPEDPGITASAAAGSGGYTPTARTGAMDINENPEAASVFPAPQSQAPADNTDSLKRLAAQLNMANSVAGMGRGLVSDLSRPGPGGSPLAARPMGTAGAYQPTARAGGMRLSDILGRR